MTTIHHTSLSSSSRWDHLLELLAVCRQIGLDDLTQIGTLMFTRKTGGPSFMVPVETVCTWETLCKTLATIFSPVPGSSHHHSQQQNQQPKIFLTAPPPSRSSGGGRQQQIHLKLDLELQIHPLMWESTLPWILGRQLFVDYPGEVVVPEQRKYSYQEANEGRTTSTTAAGGSSLSSSHEREKFPEGDGGGDGCRVPTNSVSTHRQRRKTSPCLSPSPSPTLSTSIQSKSVEPLASGTNRLKKIKLTFTVSLSVRIWACGSIPYPTRPTRSEVVELLERVTGAPFFFDPPPTSATTLLSKESAGDKRSKEDELERLRTLDIMDAEMDYRVKNLAAEEITSRLSSATSDDKEGIIVIVKEADLDIVWDCGGGSCTSENEGSEVGADDERQWFCEVMEVRLY